MEQKRILAILVVAIIVGAGAAVYLLAPMPPPEEERINLTVGTSGSIGRVLHPLTVHGSDDPMVFNMFEGLFEPDLNSMEYVPNLAKGYGTVSEDGLEWTFELVEGVTFHDGTPFNASCIDYYVDLAFEHGAGMTYWFTEGVVNHTEVVDEYTIKYVLEKPNSFFRTILGNIASFIPSPTAVEKYGVENVNDHPVGTGPLKFVSRTPDEEVILEANDDWWQLDEGAEITVNQVFFKQVADRSTLKLALQNGELDCTLGRLNIADYPDLIDDPDIKEYDISHTASPRWLAFQMNDTVWDVFPNKKMRQAFSYAIPYDEIISGPLDGLAQREYSLLGEYYPNYKKVANYDYNVTKAQELIAEAGFSTPVEVTLHITPTHYGSTEPDIAALIKDRADDAGFDVSIVEEEYGAYKERWYDTAEQEMNLWTWGGDNAEYNYFANFIVSTGWGMKNVDVMGGDMADLYPYVDNIYEEYIATTNETRKHEIAIELQEIWAEWQPNIFGWRGASYQFSQAELTISYGGTINNYFYNVTSTQ